MANTTTAATSITMTRAERVSLYYRCARNAVALARYYAERRLANNARGGFSSRESEAECLDRVANYRRLIRQARAAVSA